MPLQSQLKAALFLLLAFAKVLLVIQEAACDWIPGQQVMQCVRILQNSPGRMLTVLHRVQSAPYLICTTSGDAATYFVAVMP